MTRDLGKKKYFRITLHELENLEPSDSVMFTLPEGRLNVPVGVLLDRFSTSKSWSSRGEHSSLRFPQWLAPYRQGLTEPQLDAHRDVAQSKPQAKPQRPSPIRLEAQRSDIAIICALREPELGKILRTGKKEEWKKLSSEPDDPQTYHQGTYTTAAGKKLQVIASAMNQMGPPAAAALAAKMILRFKPRLMAMVGIAAGAKADSAGFGDILAPDITFDYTSGKVVDANGKSVFKPDYKPFHLDSRIISLLKDWQAESHALYDIWRDWPGLKPQRPPHLVIGPLGSGSSVVANSAVVDDVGTHWRKLVGIEMEAYAVHCACRNTLTPETPYIAFKSVCDFANNVKNDEWQPYAAYTAAEAFHRFIVTEWENLHLEPSSSLPAAKSDE